MIGQFKKVKSFSDIKTGDNIVLYFHQSSTSKTVREKYYHVTLKTNKEIECTRLNKEGKTFYNRWYESEDALFTKVNKRNDVFIDKYGYGDELYYTSPDIPCGLIINKLMEQKRKINKTIIDLQHLMYSVE